MTKEKKKRLVKLIGHANKAISALEKELVFILSAINCRQENSAYNKMEKPLKRAF